MTDNNPLAGKEVIEYDCKDCGAIISVERYPYHNSDHSIIKMVCYKKEEVDPLISSLQAEIDKCKAVIRAKEQWIHNDSDEIREANIKLKEKDALIEQLRKESEKWVLMARLNKEEVNQVRVLKDEYGHQVTELTKQLSQKDAELEDAKEEHKDCQEIYLQDDDELAQQNKQFRQQISTLQKELAELEAAHNSCLKENNEVYKEQIAKLKSALDIEKEWSKTMEAELKSKKERCAAYEVVLKAKEAELEQLRKNYTFQLKLNGEQHKSLSRLMKCGAHSGDFNEKKFCQYCLAQVSKGSW